MNTKHEPCSICEKYMDGIVCDEDECPVAIMKAEIERLKEMPSVMNCEYEWKEIQELYLFCQKLSIPVKIESLYDGFAIRFEHGHGDFVQHHGSYGSQVGCVEPAIGSRLDYTAVELKNAKRLVKRNKERLCK